MKWFIGVIDLDGGIVDVPNISGLVLKQFQDIEILEVSNSFEYGAFAVADNCGNKPMIYEYKNLILVGDVRIDNKKELAMIFNLDDQIKDEIFLLYLYERYGNDFLVHIVGEFAFIILNKQNKSCFSVRDHMGMKTLFWSQKANKIWLSSDLFLLENVIDIHNLNKEYFSEFYYSNGSVDTEATPFVDIFRVPSAHFLLINRSDVILKQYWSIVNSVEPIRYKNEKDYEDQFLFLMKESVSCRLSKNRNNGVMMSGGLDSTAVFAVAKILEKESSSQNIKAVCGVFNKYLECDERQYIQPVAEMYKETPIYEVCDDYGILKDFPYDSPWTYEPHVNAMTFMFTKSIVQRAHKEGISNILSGYAGDHVLGGSTAVVSDLIKDFKLFKACSHVYNYASGTRQSFIKILMKEGILPLFGLGWIKEFKRSRGKSLAYGSRFHTVGSINQKDFYRQLLGTKARLFSDRVIGPQVGIDFQHPFLDRRLVEFLFRIPGEVRWSHGNTKNLLRKAMVDYLPSCIRERNNKTEHLALTYHGLRESWPILVSILRETRIEWLGYINKLEWERELHKWRQGMDVREDFWILLTLEIWLYRYSNLLNSKIT